jgi:hypothetical protein
MSTRGAGQRGRSLRRSEGASAVPRTGVSRSSIAARSALPRFSRLLPAGRRVRPRRWRRDASAPISASSSISPRFEPHIPPAVQDPWFRLPSPAHLSSVLEFLRVDGMFGRRYRIRRFCRAATRWHAPRRPAPNPATAEPPRSDVAGFARATPSAEIPTAMKYHPTACRKW